MADAATKRLRLMKQETFEHLHTWGINLNGGGLDMADDGWGSVEVPVNGTYVLTTQNFVSDEARRFFLLLTGAGGTVTAPAVDKPYLVDNRCAAAVVIQPLAGTGVSIPAGTVALVFSNAAGSAFFAAALLPSRPGARTSAFNNKITDLADGAGGSQDAANMRVVEQMIASGALANLPSIIGHENQVLHVDPTGQFPIWRDVDHPPPTGLVPILTQSVTTPVANVDFTSGIDATYDEYQLHFFNVLPASSGNPTLSIRTSADGGATWDAGASDYYLTVNGSGGSSSEVQISTGNSAGIGATGRVIVARPSVAQMCSIRSEAMEQRSSTTINERQVSAQRSAAAVVSGIRLRFSSGNIASGLFRLYGVAK